MSKKSRRNPSRSTNQSPGASGVGTKGQRVSPVNSPMRTSGNPGGTNEAGNDRVQGASHQGSSLGKRNSG